MDPEQQLSEFAKRVREWIDKIGSSKGKDAERLQSELSHFLAEGVQLLMARGVSLTRIEKVIREATDVVPQTYAPDADEQDDYVDEPMGSPTAEVMLFLPMDEGTVEAFAEGKISSDEMMDMLSTPDAVPIELSLGLELVLTDFGKDETLSEATGGGEIVAGPDGEAFIPELLDMRTKDGGRFYIADPLVFKTVEEVRNINSLLEPIGKEGFFKKAKIKKLIDSGWLDGYDEKSVKKEADNIIGMLWEEFVLLRSAYVKAAEENKGMAVFGTYVEDDDDIE